MRRGIGIVLAFIGVLLLAGAAILRWVVAPNALKAPIEEDGEPYTVMSIATGTGSLLNQDTGQVAGNIPLRSERVITADVDASTDDIAVWDVEVVTEVEPTGTEISSTTDRVAFDRKTSEAVSGFDEAVDGDTDVTHEGTISYKFPFDTQQETYSYFDTTTRQGWPAEFQGTEDVAGLETYHFTQVVEPTEIGQVEVPGAQLGLPLASVQLDQVYSTTRDFFVEPETGIIIRASEDTQRVLQFAPANVEVPAFSGELEFDEATVAARADDANDAKDSITAVRDTWPLIGAIAGVVLLILGLLLARRSRTPAVAEGAAATAGAAGAAVASGADETVTPPADTVADAQQTVQDTAAQASESADETLAGAQESAQQAVDDSTAQATEAQQNAQQAVDDTTAQTSDAADTVVERAEDAGVKPDEAEGPTGSR